MKERAAPYGTVLETWYPLGHGDSGLLNEPVFTELARIRALDCGKRYYTATLEEQERNFTAWVPVD